MIVLKLEFPGINVPSPRLPGLTIEYCLPAFSVVCANQDKCTGDRGGGFDLISGNAGAHGHAIEATGVLVQMRQYGVQYVRVEPNDRIKCSVIQFHSPSGIHGALNLHDRHQRLGEDVLDRTHDVHVRTRAAHPSLQHEIRFRNCPFAKRVASQHWKEPKKIREN